jgi:glutathione synthase
MQIKLGIVMDPVPKIQEKKDSSLAMLSEAKKRGWQVYCMEQKDLFIKDGVPMAKTIALKNLDVILMRKDPPFDVEYIYTTHILELAEKQGVLVVNKPQSLRDANEKLFITNFPECCPPHIVTRNANLLRDFISEHQEVVLKPLHGMGGMSIFHLRQGDLNTNVVIETLTNHGTCFIMAQKFIPEIKYGDKRILMVNGEPVPYALARTAAPGELRANIAAGGCCKSQTLSERDIWICQQISPVLRAKGLYFVGLDIIGDFLTEINVTSPGCIREMSELSGINVSERLLDFIEEQTRLK